MSVYKHNGGEGQYEYIIKIIQRAHVVVTLLKTSSSHQKAKFGIYEKLVVKSDFDGLRPFGC